MAFSHCRRRELRPDASITRSASSTVESAHSICQPRPERRNPLARMPSWMRTPLKARTRCRARCSSNGRVVEMNSYDGIQVGSQPYSPSHGMVPLSNSAPPWRIRSSCNPGSNSSAAIRPRCNRTCGCRSWGTPLREAGTAGSLSRSTIVTVVPAAAQAAAAKRPARLPPMTTTSRGRSA